MHLGDIRRDPRPRPKDPSGHHLVTDGVNTFGKKKLDDAVQAALRSEAIIYSVGIGDNFYSGVDKGSLNKISERTGGRAYFPRDESELRDAFKQIQDEMRSQYLIAYEPSNQTRDGSYRTIEIQLTNPHCKKTRSRSRIARAILLNLPQEIIG